MRSERLGPLEAVARDQDRPWDHDFILFLAYSVTRGPSRHSELQSPSSTRVRSSELNLNNRDLGPTSRLWPIFAVAEFPGAPEL